MQLRIARLCLDCDEVHDEARCPSCASEAFAFLTRWVPAPERRMRPRQTTSSQADVYRELTGVAPKSPKRGSALKKTAVAVMALSAAGWLWRSNQFSKSAEPSRSQ